MTATSPGSSTPSHDGPVSINDLFDADPASAEQAVAAPPRAAGEPGTAGSFDTPASSDTPGDPLDVEHEDEDDDVDRARPEEDPEHPWDRPEEDDLAADLDEEEVDGHTPFVDTDPSTDDASADPAEVTFADLGLPADLLKAVTDMGYQTPTAIQREAIPVLLSGRDVVGVAQTGTGKTAAFGLPLLDAVDASDGSVQALVLAPTRELALQSADAITDMARRSRGLDVVAVYGGAPYGPQIGALKDGAQVVVGTPGRVIDLIDKGALRLDAVRYFVLDEADEMLRMGFAEDVETIAASLPEQRRTALFSATMPPAIQAVARQHLTDPERIEVSRQSSTVDTVHQTYAVVPFRHKIGAVARVLAVTEAQAAIVFVRTKSTAEDVAIELAGRGIQAAAISGDVPQRERERLVERLRAGTLDVLVATDVAARGLDVDRIGLVVNFDVPREAEAYVHRIGRTGRAGRHGEAVTFLTPKEKNKLRQIERLTGTRLEEITLPSPADVSSHRAKALLERATARHERGRLGMYADLVETATTELGIDSLAMASTLLALAVGDEGPRRAEPGQEREDRRRRREENLDAEGSFVSASFEGSRRDRNESKRGAARGGRRQEEGTGTVYRIEVGHRDRVLPGAIVGALANEGGISGSDIGKIDILQSFSLVEIHTELSPDQLEAMGRATFGGREMRIRPDEGPGHGWDGPRDRRPHDSAERRAGRGRFERDERRGPRGSGRFEDRRDRGDRRERRDSDRWQDRSERGYRGGDQRREGREDRRYDRRERRDSDRWQDRPERGYRGGDQRREGREDRRYDRREDRGERTDGGRRGFRSEGQGRGRRDNRGHQRGDRW
ncbi:DEAD/DEAH box helicase [Actinomyces howellii]|uniref:RNA helicase n=1 Tax=Actinomyces howellii TaxID=52771 RepID=A0A3S4QZB9_9ACTO|nr:DEAD/DEAH box helicase [Actinomyces howellii]VEG25980.1 DEAD-box ATP-dependent RNA helicase CshA [Actinomyces howellii]